MANPHVATYLNDHLAGSAGALELLAHLETAHRQTPLGEVFTELRVDIAQDREELETLMERLQIARSRTRQATAWLAEKVAVLKLRLDDPAGGPLRLLESLEALALGIEGKVALWQALAVAAEDAPGFRLLDYEILTERAEEQRCRVEEVRLQAAKKALIPE